MRKAFTITELLVAVGLLAVVLAACGIIFNYSIDAQRTAGATAEIMRNLRVITDQLNADFAGYVGLGYIKPNSDQVNADEIVFLTTGDFQTAGVYGTNNESVRGNIARIYYGQATDPNLLILGDEYGRKKILIHKQVIVAPAQNNSTEEYEPNSLVSIQKKYQAQPSYFENIWLVRPTINITGDPNSIRMYLVSGVDDFKIDYFVGFNGNSIHWQSPAATESINTSALRFTFTLYDSKGIIKTGKRFEHIVYIKK